jgi:hypothetical protein
MTTLAESDRAILHLALDAKNVFWSNVDLAVTAKGPRKGARFYQTTARAGTTFTAHA